MIPKTSSLQKVSDERYAVTIGKINVGMIFVCRIDGQITVSGLYGCERLYGDNIPDMALDDPCLTAHIDRAHKAIQERIDTEVSHYEQAVGVQS